MEGYLWKVSVCAIAKGEKGKMSQDLKFCSI